MLDVNFFSANGLFSGSIEALLFILFAFTSGLAIQAISSWITKDTKYPSSYYLNTDNETIPEYMKKDIRKYANQMFGTPLNASSQTVFDVCYICLLQNKVTNRLQMFLCAYTLARSMLATMVIEAPLLAIWAIIKNEPIFLIAALVAIGLAKLFNGLFLAYQKTFAKEGFRSFFIYSRQQNNFPADFDY